VATLTECEHRVDTLRCELAQLDSPALLDQLSDKRLERQLTERAAHWRQLLAGGFPLARQALRALMARPIWFVPEQNGGYRLRGATRLGSFFDEQAALRWRPHGDSNATQAK
jgi:hypothetical protein